MRQNSRTRISFEPLEDRVVPSVTAKVIDGSLRVAGAATVPGDFIRVTMIGEDVAKVHDGTTLVGEFKFTKNLDLRLGEAADKVRVNLGGFGVRGHVSAVLGVGPDDLRVENGTIGKGLFVTSDKGDDTVVAAKVRVDGPVGIDTNIGTDVVWFGPGFAGGAVSVKGAENVALGKDAKAVSATVLASRTNDSKVAIAGAVRDNLVVIGSEGIDVSLAKTSTALTVQGSVGGLVTFRGGAVADSVRIDPSAVIGGAVLSMGGGADGVAINGSVSKPGTLTIEAGAGDDKVGIGRTARVGGPAVVLMGAGNDLFTLAGAAEFEQLVADGGAGKDTFGWNSKRPGLTVVNFEVFLK
jgi:hypothetical protein